MITRDVNVMKNINVDKVIFIAYGKVVGEGIHKDLMKNNNSYYELIRQI